MCIGLIRSGFGAEARAHHPAGGEPYPVRTGALSPRSGRRLRRVGLSGRWKFPKRALIRLRRIGIGESLSDFPSPGLARRKPRPICPPPMRDRLRVTLPASRLGCLGQRGVQHHRDLAQAPRPTAVAWAAGVAHPKQTGDLGRIPGAVAGCGPARHQTLQPGITHEDLAPWAHWHDNQRVECNSTISGAIARYTFSGLRAGPTCLGPWFPGRDRKRFARRPPSHRCIGSR